MLDEPAAGMNSEEIGQLRDRILKLRAQGITIVLIEHVMELVMGVTDRIAVLNFGQKIAEGSRPRSRPIRWCARPTWADLMLRVQDLVTAYGKIEALKGVSLEVAQGSITCLLGPNGAGKTTLMMTIAGILKPKAGSVSFFDQKLSGLPPHDRGPRHRARAGEPARLSEHDRAREPARRRLSRRTASKRTSRASSAAFRASRSARRRPRARFRAASSRCSRWRAR